MYESMLGGLLILTIVWLVLRIRRNKAAQVAESRPAAKSTGAYNAVAIMYSESSCNAAKAMTGRRFLSSAAPRLPLAECNNLECRCKFVSYDDRRTGRDRRSPFTPAGTVGATGSYKKERRETSDRRKNGDEFQW